MRRLLSPIPLVVIASVVALLALLAYGLSATGEDRKIDQAVAHGDRAEAPDIELPKLFGSGRESLSDYRGKVVVLNVWASWCEPCRKESPLLQRWHRRIEKRGGTVLGVDVLDVSSDARKFARDYGLTYPMLRDSDGSTIDDLGVAAYPETFVIDKRGLVAAIRRGEVNDAFMREEVVPLLDPPST